MFRFIDLDGSALDEPKIENDEGDNAEIGKGSKEIHDFSF